MQLRDVLAEWYECKERHLEVLETKWNADYGYAESDTKAHMHKRYLNTTEHDPYDIYDDGQASGVIRS